MNFLIILVKNIYLTFNQVVVTRLGVAAENSHVPVVHRQMQTNRPLRLVVMRAILHLHSHHPCLHKADGCQKMILCLLQTLIGHHLEMNTMSTTMILNSSATITVHMMTRF